MGAIVIKADTKSNKLLKELAEKLGASVTAIDEDQYEEVVFGQIMDTEKTGKKASRAAIFKKLNAK